MKNIVALSLTALTIFLVLMSSYYKNETKVLEDKLAQVDKSFDDVKKVSETNKWIKENMILYVDNLLLKDDAEKSLMNIIESIKEPLGMKIDNINRDKAGQIVISVNSKIKRDDINAQLKLFKMTIPNGHINMK